MSEQLVQHEAWKQARARLMVVPPPVAKGERFVQPKTNEAFLLARIDALEAANKQLCNVLQIHHTRLSKTESETELLIEQIRRRNLTGKVMVIRDCPKVSDIQAIAAKYFQLTLDELCGDCRIGRIVYARQIAMYLALKLSRRSSTFIGSEFGGRDHSTILHASRKTTQRMETNRQLAEDVEALTALVERAELERRVLREQSANGAQNATEQSGPGISAQG
jgi:chromosomal replication initiation ATPase DnaA